ncbi:MAG: hypothetical protein Kow0062_03980 [Acidobacteriota bacterium]
MTDPTVRRERLGLALILLGQLALAIPLGIRHALEIRPDSIAYLRIARYVAEGRFDLAVSGYWGPLLSWIAAPVVRLTDHPVAPARVAMIVASLVMTLGAFALLRRLELEPRLRLFAAALVALAAGTWSARPITPDMLLAGLLLWGASRLVDPTWPDRRGVQLAAGALLGLAYLAKAVALPVGAAFVLVACGLWAVAGRTDVRRLASAAGVTLLLFAALAGPWIAVLSARYGRPTFSTSGRINQAIVGPDVPEGRAVHQYRVTIARPQPGRVTVWEDPGESGYPRWSPTGSLRELRHQFVLVRRNHVELLKNFVAYDLLTLGPLALFAALLFHRPWRENMRRERWRWLGAFALPALAIYLPVYARAARYLFPVYPMMIGATLGLIAWTVAPPAGVRDARWRRWLPFAAAFVSFGVPATLDLAAAAAAGSPPVVVAARQLGEALARSAPAGAGIVGGGDAGLYTAFFADQPWCGDVQYERWTAATVKEHREALAGAPCRWVLVRHDPGVENALGSELGFADVTGAVLGDPDLAARFPLRLFERREPPARGITAPSE